MDQQQERELLDFLASAGFAGDTLEEDIRKNIKLNLPYFTVKHRAMYGEEMMLFDLRFRMDPQFKSYRLENYKATHRTPVEIEHKLINGINTSALEEMMKWPDWEQYFRGGDTPSDEKFNKPVREIVDTLNRLSEGQNFDGIKIQQELMFKYWPERIHTAATEELKHLYDRSREFIPIESGICHAHIAYHSLSGRLDDLAEKLSLAGLDDFADLDLYKTLENTLSRDPDSFSLNPSRDEPEGLAEFTFPIVKVNGNYHIDTYSVSLTPFPEIEHGHFNGIDTRELERMMREIDWHNDSELFIFREDAEPDFFPNVNDVQEQMYRLSKDMAGGDIADLLQIKYWTGATFFSDMIQQTGWDMLAGLPKRTESFPIEVNINIASNLLYGRAVMDINLYLMPPDDASSWMRLDLSKRDENGQYPIMKVEGLSTKELTGLLSLLPIHPSDFRPTRDSLLRGDVVPVRLTSEVKVLLEANPEQRTINITTPDHRPIPFNFHFDADWMPEKKTTQETVQEQEQTTQKNHRFKMTKPLKNKRGKGRGI